jgi:hypothetical protein
MQSTGTVSLQSALSHTQVSASQPPSWLARCGPSGFRVLPENPDVFHQNPHLSEAAPANQVGWRMLSDTFFGEKRRPHRG